MKKLLTAVAAFAMLFTSCAKDETFAPVENQEALVSFTVKTPAISTRYGEGNNATKLHWAVYDGTEGYVAGLSSEEKGVATLENLSTTIELNLVEGRSYDLVFWAQAEGAPYTIDWNGDKATNAEATAEDATMSIDLTTVLTANNEDYDAFFGSIELEEVRGAVNKTVELYRPFAQLNVATSDTDKAAAAGVEIAKTGVTIEGVYTSFNLKTGDVMGEATTVSFKASSIQEFIDNESQISGNDLISMNYLLVGSKKLVDVTLNLEDNGSVLERKYTSVPVERNYRTNILGTILTNAATFTVEVKPDWEKPNYEVSIDPWDGTADTSWYDDTKTEFTLTNPQQLAGLAKLVDEGNTFEGKTIKLDTDLDLYKTKDGEPICFDPIGSYRNDASFKGTFDGQGHTISNLSQNTWALDNGYYYTDCGLGLFGQLEDATVKDLKIDNANISGESAICGVVAAVANNTTFENITVSNSNCADYQYYAGGIIGWASGEIEFKNCNVDASTNVAAQWGDFDNSIGGVIGGASGSAEILMKDCTVACRIDAYNDVTSSYQWYAYRRAGMLIGNPGKTKEVGGTTYADAPQLTCENVTVIYGDWANYTYCEFAGTSWPYVRVQAGVSNSAYSNPRYGHPTDVNGKEVVDDDHVHNAGEDHHILCRFDQLYGGGQGVYGTPTHEGVTVKYPYSVAEEATTADDVVAAINSGKNVKLAADVNIGNTQLALAAGQKIDLNGKTLSTSNNYGGITMKNGASIKNGVINHTGNTAAIKAWNVDAIEDVVINVTPTDGKVKGGIVLQSGADSQIGLLKNVTITGVTNGIETYNCGWTDETPAIVAMENVNIDATDTGILLSAHIGKATNCQIKGANYGINMHLKGEFKVGIELEGCTVTGATASIWGHDEVGISNTNNCSLTLTYDAATTLNGPFIWDFEDECKSVVTLNQPL